MNKEEKATAYHEAGHALAAYRFGHYGGRITIVPNGDRVGRSLSEAEWGDGSTDIEQIIVLFAGLASESKYNADANKLGSSDDDEKAADLLERTNETESSLRKKAKELIDKNWQIIEAIAEKLFIHKTLEDDEWQIIIDAFDEGDDWEEKFDEMRAAIEENRRRQL
jgi:ATP-dependent Zn protease